MRFLRSKRLQRILLPLMLVLLMASPFDFIAQQEEEKGELFIHATEFSVQFSSALQEDPVKYSFDAVLVSAVTISKETISDGYIPKTSVDPFPVDFLTDPSRAPPCPMAVL